MTPFSYIHSTPLKKGKTEKPAQATVVMDATDYWQDQPAYRQLTVPFQGFSLGCCRLSSCHASLREAGLHLLKNFLSGTSSLLGGPRPHPKIPLGQTSLS